MKRNNRNRLEYIFYQTFLNLVTILPASFSRWIGKKIGLLAFHILKSRRQLTIENIKNAREKGFLPEVTSDERLARQVWEHLGLVGREFLFYYNLPPERIKSMVKIEGEENLKQVLTKKKGVVLVTAHIGNWELIGIYLSLLGYQLSPVIKEQSNAILDRIVQEKRQSVGMKLISTKSFLRAIIMAFQRNEIVSFPIDQNARKKGVTVNFFGRDTNLPAGPAEFALRNGTPVIFVYIVRQAPDQHLLVISKEIQLKNTGNHPQDVKDNIEMFSGLIQEVIKKYPTQWLWMHNLWPTRIKV